MSVAPLDVNVLIALLDRRHVHHEAVLGWFATAQADGWATCSLTQNAVLRILGQPRHPNSPGPPAVVAPLVAELIRHPRHQFWPDSLRCELGDLLFRFGDQALLGTGAAVGGDQGFPHVAVEVAQIGEVNQLVHQRKAPGSGLVDLGGRLAGGCGCRHGRACRERQRGKGRALAGGCSCERQRRQRLLTEDSAER
jgi:hypothetical protein